MPATRKSPARRVSSGRPRTAGDAIARMPRDLRDKISRALADGCTWRKVAEIAAEAGHPGITAQNVTNYRKGGHKEWLRCEERLKTIRQESDVTASVLKFYADNGGSPAEAGVLAAADMMARALQGMDVATLQTLMADNPAKFLGIANSLVSMARFFGDQRAEARQEKKEEAADTPESKFTPKERSARIKEIFGLS